MKFARALFEQRSSMQGRVLCSSNVPVRPLCVRSNVVANASPVSRPVRLVGGAAVALGRFVPRSFAKSNLWVCANCMGETPNSDSITLRKCLPLMPISSASSSTPSSASAPSSILFKAIAAKRLTASMEAFPGASSGRQRKQVDIRRSPPPLPLNKKCS